MSLLEAQAKDAPFLITPKKIWSYGEVQAGLKSPKDVCRPILGPCTVSTILDILACLENGVTAVLASTREPQAKVRAWFDALDCDALANTSIATLLPTSGATGTPKAVAHTLAQHLYSARHVAAFTQFGPGKRWLLNLPLYHVSGLSILFRALVSGGAIVVRESADESCEQLMACEPTHASLVATQLKSLIQESAMAACLARMDCVLLGGSHFPEDLIQKLRDKQIPFNFTFGTTETASGIWHDGQLLGDTCLRISPAGEIQISGSTVCAGYWRQGSLVSAVDDEGYFHTRDLGFLRQDGQLMVLGRMDHMINSGGEKMHPEEIENVLMEHPNVDYATVVKQAHSHYGERPVAFIRSRSGRSLDAEGLKKFLLGKLAPIKVPDAFFEWPDGLEYNPKTNRKELQQLKKAAEEICSPI